MTLGDADSSYVTAVLGLTSLVWNLFGPRPKRPARPARAGSGMRVSNPGPGAPPLRRPVASPRARAA